MPDFSKAKLLWWELVILAGILVIGLGLRGLYLHEVSKAPFFESPGVDAGFHDYWARGLATGNWTPPLNNVNPKISETAYLRPPGYPYFLAIIYMIAGEGYLTPRIIQMGLGLASCFLAYLLGRKWYGRVVALIFSAMMSIYWIFIYFEAEFHAPALFIFQLLLFVLMLGYWKEKMTFAPALCAGIVGGLCSLVRPNALLLLIAGVIWALWISRKRKNMRSFLFAMFGLIFGCTVAISPATIRNYFVTKDFVLISSNAGINFFIGNNEYANGLVTAEIPGLGKFGTCYDWPGIVANLEKKLGRKLKDSEVSSYFIKEGLRFIGEHPGDFLRLTLKKALLFWGPREVAHNKEIHYEREFSTVLQKIPGNYALVLSLGIIGFAILLLDYQRKHHQEQPSYHELQDRWEMSVLIGLLVLAYFFSVLPFFAAGRYRLPVIPFLLLFGSYGIYRFSIFVITRNVRSVLACIVIFAAAYALTTRPFADYEPSLARWYYDKGTMYDRTGQPDQALAHYRKAVEADPNLYAAHYNLAHKLMEQGKINEAIFHWTETVRLNPSFAAGHYNLAIAHQKQGDLDKAISHMKEAIFYRPETAKYHMHMGDFLADRGDIDQAIWHYRKVLSLKPKFIRALRNLAWILATYPDAKLRDPIEAIRLAEHAQVLTSGRSLGVLDTLAAAYAAAGRFPEAIETAQKAFDLAWSSGKQDIAKEIQLRMELYMKGKPYQRTMRWEKKDKPK